MKLCEKNKNRLTTLLLLYESADTIAIWHSYIPQKCAQKWIWYVLAATKWTLTEKKKPNVSWVLVSYTIHHKYNVHSTETELLFGFYLTYPEIFYKMVTNLQSSLCLLADTFVRGIQWVKYQKSSSFEWSTQTLWSSWYKLGFPITHQNQKDD